MNVVILSYDLEFGGAERQSVLDANGLARRGHAVTYAASFSGPLDALLDPGIPRVLVGKVKIWPAARALRRALRALPRPFALHAHMAWAEMAGALCLPGGCRLFWNEHGPGLWRRPHERAVFRAMALRAERVLASCEAVRRIRVEREGIPERKTAVVYNGLSPELEALALETPPRREGGPFTLGFVGRFHPIKRVGLLVDLAARLAREGIDFKMLLVGDGQDRPEVLRQIADSGLEERVECPGFSLDPTAVLRRCHAFLLPSRLEGMSLALMEACCAGIPCVAFDVGGNGEILRHGETGFLIGDGDLEGFHRAVVKLGSDESLRRSMGLAARAFVTGAFSMGRRLDALERLYGGEG